jgi:hypothetical protein
MLRSSALPQWIIMMTNHYCYDLFIVLKLFHHSLFIFHHFFLYNVCTFPNIQLLCSPGYPCTAWVQSSFHEWKVHSGKTEILSCKSFVLKCPHCQFICVWTYEKLKKNILKYYRIHLNVIFIFCVVPKVGQQRHRFNYGCS